MSCNEFLTRSSVAVAYGILGTSVALVVLLAGAGLAMVLAGGRPQVVQTWTTPGSSQQSLAVVQRVPASAVAEGSMVVVERSGSRTLHRIASVERSDAGVRGFLETRVSAAGDPQPILLDGQVPVAKLHLPAGGRLLELLRHPIAGLVLAMLALSPLVAMGNRARFRGPIPVS